MNILLLPLYLIRKYFYTLVLIIFSLVILEELQKDLHYYYSSLPIIISNNQGIKSLKDSDYVEVRLNLDKERMTEFKTLTDHYVIIPFKKTKDKFFYVLKMQPITNKLKQIAVFPFTGRIATVESDVFGDITNKWSIDGTSINLIQVSTKSTIISSDSKVLYTSEKRFPHWLFILISIASAIYLIKKVIDIFLITKTPN